MSASLEFVDTNILLYAFDSTEPDKHSSAKKLLERLWEQQNGCISVQVLQEFFVNATRKLKKPLTRIEARAVLEDYSLWIIHVPSAAEVIMATTLMDTTSISFWDAMMVTSALELDCRVVWSEDLNAGQKINGLEIHNPFAYSTLHNV